LRRRAAPAAPGWQLLTLAFVALLVGFTPATAFDDAALARRALERHILPGYENFADAAKTFAHTASELCRKPSEATLEETRATARDTLLAWGRIEHIRFGPISKDQRLDRMLLYPAPRGIVPKQIARLLRQKDLKALEPHKLAHASVAVQGFTAIVPVLFGKGSNQLALSASPNSFRCQYVEALAEGIAQIASETLGDWSGAFGQTWLNPGPENPAFLNAKETTRALYRSYVTELEVARLQRLAPMLQNETENGTHAEPLFPNSELGLPFILANIEGLRSLLTESGFIDATWATDEKEQTAQAILRSVETDLGFSIRAGKSALAIAPNALADPEARKKLVPMTFALKNAEVTGRSALGTLTGLFLGFNSLDGD